MRVIGLLLSIWGMSAFAYHAQINCTSTNLTTTYSTGLPSLQPSLTAMQIGQAHLGVWNPSSTRICVDTGSYNASIAPAVGGINEHCIPASSFFAWDFLTINGNVFVRADGSNCTSTIIDVDVW